MDRAKAAAILAKRRAKLPPPFKLEDVLFPEQLALVRDPAKFATAVTSVRAGKTVSCAADMLDTCVRLPGTTSLYLTLTRSNAKRIVWPELLRMNREYKLGAKVNLAELNLTFPSGSICYLGGANTEEEIEKCRGLSNVALAYCDESQAFRPYLKELVEDILTKRLYDTNGRCRLIGTPGPIPSGYFHDASISPRWSHHRWTLHQNPFIQKKSGMSVEQLIQQDCEMRGVSIDHPSIRRECFGEWVLDQSSLILNYMSDVAHFDELPSRTWSYVLGVDVGFVDADAIVVLAYCDDESTTYLVHEEICAKQDLTSLANTIRKLQTKYSVGRSVIDEGGLGKKLAEELRNRWGIHVEPADKSRKMENLAILNDALRSGRFKAKRDSRFASDCMHLEIDRDRSRPDKLVVSDKFHSDVVDSVLYAFKLSPAYSWEPAKPAGPAKGSKEWYEKQAAIDWEREREKLVQEEQGDSNGWPSDGSWGKF
jgi:hypothetical protein